MRKLASLGRHIAEQFEIRDESDDRLAVEVARANKLLTASLFSLDDDYG